MKAVRIAQMAAYVVDSAVATVCMTYLSIHFGKWWIALFAIFLSPSFKAWAADSMIKHDSGAVNQEKP